MIKLIAFLTSQSNHGVCITYKIAFPHTSISIDKYLKLIFLFHFLVEIFVKVLFEISNKMTYWNFILEY